ncbi:cystathionine beta-lyase [Undibacterium sp. RTI2.1]|uniref:cystathionine beta-lyase n=1 Tax=unclassified Undibacterium TaxID=2630295 RepID=UPI002AB3C36A|nr:MULTISPECIES: cystathionine beta-lyase [unclassified Undibacterium]MDY7539202.1 cystathionine beta-lyase [Undibacterium sp. 5I1]MEB0031053.1 cystathionine beta-lyase [Undibacterium sp. RTI2.1]MEB0116260.1 cystathionine beta-lyase [Undibacterium sp. RTI2.2]MEB0231127.1 cystathionine beta-lyase [Undibacterium sp. 10I3]MEB0257000.1 cystathionine beta-lyase [Undibacterium sp. 5I1]
MSKHDPQWQTATKLTHAGRKGKAHHGPVNPPVIRASTMLFPNVAGLKEATGTRAIYGRHGNETTLALEHALCAAEGAAACLLTPSGLSAITTTLLALLKPGDHLLMVDTTYDPTRLFCDGLLKKMGISTTYYDPLIGRNIASLMQPNTKVVFVESPGSLTFEVQDIPAMAAVAHASGAVIVSDSTWATPIGWSSFELGIDVSLHAATKYIVGHSDAMMGVILTKEALHPRLRDTYKQLGLSVGADDAALALRGLRTMSARLAVHRVSALHIAQWLQAQPEIAEVLYPPMPGAAGHELWKRDFHPDYACGLMGAIFHQHITEQQVAELIDRTELFGIGFSWGGYESLILPTKPKNCRTVNASQWQAPMIRLHIGLEAVQDLQHDLQQGFEALRNLDCAEPIAA